MVKINIEKLALERANQGMTLEKLSTKSNVNRATIARIEKGKTNPRLDTIGKIVKALGKDIEEFIKK